MKLIFTMQIILLSASVSWAQNIKLPEVQVSALLCKSWIIESLFMDGLKMTLPENDTLIFYPNHTSITKSSLSGKINYTWQYDKKKKIVIIMLGKLVVGNVSEISNTKLTYKPKIFESELPGPKSIIINCIPL